MKQLSKNIPSDYEYTIKLTGRELVSIRECLYAYYIGSGVQLNNYSIQLLDDIDKILYSN